MQQPECAKSAGNLGGVCLQQLVEPLFHALHQRLAAQDQDQEVKEAAISCAATAIASLGDVTQGAYLDQIKVPSAPFSARWEEEDRTGRESRLREISWYCRNRQ